MEAQGGRLEGETWGKDGGKQAGVRGCQGLRGGTWALSPSAMWAQQRLKSQEQWNGDPTPCPSCELCGPGREWSSGRGQLSLKLGVVMGVRRYFRHPLEAWLMTDRNMGLYANGAKVGRELGDRFLSDIQWFLENFIAHSSLTSKETESMDRVFFQGATQQKGSLD